MMDRPEEKPKKGSYKTTPSGKEIMKRRSPSDLRLRPARFESDPKKAYTTEQLALIGAIIPTAMRHDRYEPNRASRLM
jgi:hypothetical protein